MSWAVMYTGRSMGKLTAMIQNSVHKLKHSRPSLVLAAAAIIASAVGTVWLVQQIHQANLQRVDTTAYQVVYLVNGQAYFGKLQNTTGDFLVLTSPYIAQSIENTDEQATDQDPAATQTTLLKVSDQIYGPDNSIAIKSSQIAFWQNLRPDSKVTAAIKAKTGE